MLFFLWHTRRSFLWGWFSSFPAVVFNLENDILHRPRERAKSIDNKHTMFDDLKETLHNCAVLAAAETVAAPLTRVKLVSQTEYAMPVRISLTLHSSAQHQSMMRTVIRRLAQNERGISPWFRGNCCDLFIAVPASALVTWSRAGDMILPLPVFRRHRDGFALWFLALWAQLAMNSVLFLALVYPLIYIRTAMALDRNVMAAASYGVSRQFASGGYRACIASALSPRGRAGGFSLYCGFSPAAVAGIVFRFWHLLLSSYSSSHSLAPASDRKRSWSTEFASSFLIAVLSGLVAFPFDTVSRWCIATQAFTQVSRKSGKASTTAAAAVSSSSAEPLVSQPRPMEMARTAYRLRGPAVFFRGVSANILRCGVVIAALHSLAPIRLAKH